jgi:hypothetical protein
MGGSNKMNKRISKKKINKPKKSKINDKTKSKVKNPKKSNVKFKYREAKKKARQNKKRIKSKRVIRTEEEKQKLRLVAEVQSKGRTTNYRLTQIKNYFGDSTEHYAGKELVARLRNLGVVTPAGKVKLGEKFLNQLDVMTLKALIKALDKFLNSEYSKVSVMKRRSEETKGMLETEYNFSDYEAEMLYEMLSNEAINEIYKYIDPSALWAMIEEAKEMPGNEGDNFLVVVKRYYDITNNIDFKKTLYNFIYYFFGEASEELKEDIREWEEFSGESFF